MADHPLRPATDRRLGRPLPHQLANQTQDPLLAPGRYRSPAFTDRISAIGLMRYYHSFRNVIPHKEVGSPRVTHPSAMHPLLGTSDLHVLGTPPAFILSQDQTLMFNPSLLLKLGPLDPTLASFGSSLWSRSTPGTSIPSASQGFHPSHLSGFQRHPTPPGITARPQSPRTHRIHPKHTNARRNFGPAAGEPFPGPPRLNKLLEITGIALRSWSP